MPTLDDTPILPANFALKANDLVALTDSDSTASSKVKKVALALLNQGFTHIFRVDFDNAELVAQTTNDTDEPITLMAIPANSIVDKVRLVVTEAFAGLVALNIFVGRTADADGYIASTSGLAATAAQNSGAELNDANEIDVVTAADQNLLITFDPAANGEALNLLTAGSCYVLASITEIADYAGLADAE